jgi:catechol 2,3-dioxygenase-like lactoylglutathione lyase family enzyme
MAAVRGPHKRRKLMDLGAFSVSLTVQDLGISRAFYEKLGFEVSGGSGEEHYLILKNGDAVIGLFEGMFEKNILTFNPGLSVRTLGRVEEFTDVRELQRRLKEAGIELTSEADEESSGPAHVTLEDPDGNPILIDQFF